LGEEGVVGGREIWEDNGRGFFRGDPRRGTSALKKVGVANGQSDPAIAMSQEESGLEEGVKYP